MSNFDEQYSKIKANFLAAGLDPDQDYFVIGDDYADDCRALWADDHYWYVGSCERGQKYETGRFKFAFDAAEYLAFLILAPALKNGKLSQFPKINWG